MRNCGRGHYFFLVSLGLALGLVLVLLTTTSLGSGSKPRLTSLEATKPEGEKLIEQRAEATKSEAGNLIEQRAEATKSEADKLTEQGVEASVGQAGPEPEAASVDLELIFSGDILLHTPIINEGLAHAVPDQNEADFSWLFKHCRDIFQQADLVVGNMEGALTRPPYSGYPGFRVPQDLAKNLAAAGFDALLTVNNHALDGGLEGVSSTVESLRAAGLEAIGSRLSAEEPVFTICERQGVKLGLTAFSYESSRLNGLPTLNGAPIPLNYQPLLDTLPVTSKDYPLYAESLAECQRRIELMRDGGADLVIFLMHWGDEYQFTPNLWQQNLAQDLAASGVDLIIGSHPHVVQPLVSLPANNPSGQLFCYYSLGNFVSSQQPDTGNTKGRAEEGALAKVLVKKDSTGCRIVRADYIPLYMQKTYPGWPAENRTYGWALPAPQCLEQLAQIEYSSDSERGPELPSPLANTANTSFDWSRLTPMERDNLYARLSEAVEQTVAIMGPPLAGKP